MSPSACWRWWWSPSALDHLRVVLLPGARPRRPVARARVACRHGPARGSRPGGGAGEGPAELLVASADENPMEIDELKKEAGEGRPRRRAPASAGFILRQQPRRPPPRARRPSWRLIATPWSRPAGHPPRTWRQVPMRWSGPVQQGQEVHRRLLPTENVLLGLLRVGLLVALAWLLLVRSGGVRLPPLRATAAAAAAMLCLLVLGGMVQPTAAHRRTPRGAPRQAARSPTLRSGLRIGGTGAAGGGSGHAADRIELQAAAVVRSAPRRRGGAARLVGGAQPAPGLRQMQGRSWLVLRPGAHTVLLSGALPRADSVQLPLGLAPRFLSVQARGWKVDGCARTAGPTQPSSQPARARRWVRRCVPGPSPASLASPGPCGSGSPGRWRRRWSGCRLRRARWSCKSRSFRVRRCSPQTFRSRGAP